MNEIFELLLAMPWILYALAVSLVVMLGILLWVCWPRKGPNRDFYDGWVSMIDRSIRQIRKDYKWNNRRAAYIQLFSELYVSLQQQTGSLEKDFPTMTRAERSVWVYLITRQRDIFYFY